ncbi:MAG TPA: zinc dependent phospholipase C family protein [Vicinamibacterales bacterium]|jgi:hypothetical protein
MRTLVVAALTALALSLPAAPRLQAWGFTGHKFIADRAVDLLPAELRPFFEKYRVSFVEHAIDPDTYRTLGWTEEDSRHFVDMDSYGPFPFRDLPHDYNAAVAARGAEFVKKNGVLPWRTQDIFDKLRDSFRQLPTSPYARDNIKLFSSVIAHYAADACQPFHAAANYDGQLTGQTGIHSRFESELFDRYQSKLKLAPGSIVAVPNVRDFIFATLADSFSDVQPVLDADRAAAQGRVSYDEGYFDALVARIQPILEARVSTAITDVASLITQAWIDAGRPPVPVDAPPRQPRPIRR